MGTQVHLPAVLQPYAMQKSVIEIEGGGTVGALLEKLIQIHPELQSRLFDSQGQIQPFINIYLNEDDIRYLKNEATPIGPNDVVTLIPAISGG